MMQSRPRTDDRPPNSDPRHQPIGPFVPGQLLSGYHMDLRPLAGSYGPPAEAGAWLDLLVARRPHVMPVTVLQLGLGAWQRSIDEHDPSRDGWARIARRVGEWATLDMDGHGRFVHHQPMPHTYRIPASWHSAMAQGLGASLLVRTGLEREADRAAASLLDPSFGLVFAGEHGPILQEYPAEPRPHVLNGWMWALYGLYDLASAPARLAPDARTAFDDGVAALVASLPAYETVGCWSTYDRYPHPIANVASAFYHRLHVNMLRALSRLAPHEELDATADRWERALANPVVRAGAVARKVGFRMVRPRGRAA